MVEKQDSKYSLKLWHERFGYLHTVIFRRLVTQGQIEGVKLSDTDNFFCDACKLGKAHRLPFKKTIEKKKWLMGEFIQSDVCGSKSVESLSGEKYDEIFIDEASGLRVMYFI